MAPVSEAKSGAMHWSRHVEFDEAPDARFRGDSLWLSRALAILDERVPGATRRLHSGDTMEQSCGWPENGGFPNELDGARRQRAPRGCFRQGTATRHETRPRLAPQARPLTTSLSSVESISASTATWQCPCNTTARRSRSEFSVLTAHPAWQRSIASRHPLGRSTQGTPNRSAFL